MGLVAREDQLAKIPIAGDKNSLLAKRDVENLTVGQACRIVSCNSRDIVPEVLKMMQNSRIGALVEQEPHAPAAA